MQRNVFNVPEPSGGRQAPFFVIKTVEKFNQFAPQFGEQFGDEDRAWLA